MLGMLFMCAASALFPVMNSNGFGLVRLLIAPSRTALQAEAGDGVDAPIRVRELVHSKRPPSQIR